MWRNLINKGYDTIWECFQIYFELRTNKKNRQDPAVGQYILRVCFKFWNVNEKFLFIVHYCVMYAILIDAELDTRHLYNLAQTDVAETVNVASSCRGDVLTAYETIFLISKDYKNKMLVLVNACDVLIMCCLNACMLLIVTFSFFWYYVWDVQKCFILTFSGPSGLFG